MFDAPSAADPLENTGLEKHPPTPLERGYAFLEGDRVFASHLAIAGVDLYTISKLLGYASIAMTQRYAHLSQDHEKLAVEKLESHLAGKNDVESERRKDHRRQ